MLFNILTLFPEWFSAPLSTAQLGKAVDQNLLDFNLVNPRDFTEDPHRTVDDRPYGGGPGMVLMLEPLVRALESLPQPGRILAMSPSGRPASQDFVRELAAEPALTLICGRYEGFDARLLDLLPIEQVSLGDIVLNGGEVAAMALVEACSRLLPGFMGKHESGDEESFSNNLLEYPHYTRPESYRGLDVPTVLLGGDHGKIALWRKEQALARTVQVRPDLLQDSGLTWAERKFIAGQTRLKRGRNLHLALMHHPVMLKEKKSGTSSLTNLDVHDIARISRSYSLGNFFVISPLEDQRRLLSTLLTHWTQGPGATSNPDRAQAMRLVKSTPDLEHSVELLRKEYGRDPVLVATSAKPWLDKKGREIKTASSFAQVRRELDSNPVLLLLGTAQGLAPQVLEQCRHILPPLRWADNYNHLPVRAAAAILLDRLLGDLG